jgi:hypothetical protein
LASEMSWVLTHNCLLKCKCLGSAGILCCRMGADKWTYRGEKIEPILEFLSSIKRQISIRYKTWKDKKKKKKKKQWFFYLATNNSWKQKQWIFSLATNNWASLHCRYSCGDIPKANKKMSRDKNATKSSPKTQ